MAVKSKPLRATVVAVTAQMIAPLVTVIALASARVVSAAVVVTNAVVVIDAAAKSVATVDARVVATADAKVVARVARHLPVMVVLPKLAYASLANHMIG